MNHPGMVKYLREWRDPGSPRMRWADDIQKEVVRIGRREEQNRYREEWH